MQLKENRFIQYWMNRYQWATKPILEMDFAAATLAFTFALFFQGANGRIGVELSVKMVPVLGLIFYAISAYISYITPRLMSKYSPRKMVSMALVVMILATIWTRLASTLISFVGAFAVYSASHFLAFTTVAVVVRMSLPSEKDLQRRGGSFFSSGCYLFSAVAQLLFFLGLKSEQLAWIILTTTVPVLTLFVLLLSQLNWSRLEKESGKEKKKSRLNWRAVKVEIDWGAIRVAAPYSTIIVCSSTTLALLQFHLGKDAYIALFVHQLVCAVGGFLPIRFAERKGDRFVTVLALLLAGCSMICILFGGMWWSILGGILLGLSIAGGRASFSQLASDHTQQQGRGVSPYYSTGVRTGSIGANLFSLPVTFGVATLTTVWLGPLSLVVVAILYTTLIVPRISQK
ncbi:Major Facilitator Superfamily protein [Seinonella peptonophila]|uniref:Major Facilitator Superfamily protein n=1 Tax=Seinonella peptonophila TaxID=112248 RepID=A0A1M5ADW6_9BACL|nr:MFS transporter [Seinonella peptonophila]SHF28423.1 Major Facilitator Superfamily protein [Seinonella peptonophila]